jgi:hypothetical protein
MNIYINMNKYIYIYYKGIKISPSISYDRPISERATCLSQDARPKRLSSARCYHDFLFGIMKQEMNRNDTISKPIRPMVSSIFLVGGIPTPLKNVKVSWEYYSKIMLHFPTYYI